MRATDKTPGGSGTEPTTQSRDATGSKQQYAGSWAEYLWHGGLSFRAAVREPRRAS